MSYYVACGVVWLHLDGGSAREPISAKVLEVDLMMKDKGCAGLPLSGMRPHCTCRRRGRPTCHTLRMSL